MKPHVRILLTMPFALSTFIYYLYADPDQDCYGLVNLMSTSAWYVVFLFTGVLALIGVFKKRKIKDLKFQPVALIIAFGSMLLLIYSISFAGHRIGEKWIVAQARDSRHSHSNYRLILGTNGNFAIEKSEVDFGCSYSGSYQRKGDTIILDDGIINKVGEQISTVYLFSKSELLPLADTVNKQIFKVVE